MGSNVKWICEIEFDFSSLSEAKMVRRSLKFLPLNWGDTLCNVQQWDYSGGIQVSAGYKNE